MASKRLKVAILFGGRSSEHEVSVVSAQAVMAALDADRFQAVPIGVTEMRVVGTARGHSGGGRQVVTLGCVVRD